MENEKMMDWIKHVLFFSLWGAPVWAYLTLLAFGVVEYLLPRVPWPRARSVGELVANALVRVLGRFPMLGPILTALGTPSDRLPPPPAVRVGALLPLLFVPALLATGCASAQKDTMMAELTLAKTTSIGYRTVDGVDKLTVDAIRAELDGGQAVKAKADYAAYKPKIEKARAALNAAEDTLENADKERVAASKINDWKNYTAWLPALEQAAATVAQVVADIKGLVQ
jgi:hypothetical protein